MKRVKLIVVGIVVVVISVLGLIIYQNSRFRLLSAEPEQNASTVAPIIFNFNRNLDNKTLSAFEIQPYVAGRSYVKDNQFIFEPEKYQLDKTYTAKLKSATAIDGTVLGEQKVVFKVTFVPLNKLSSSDKAAQAASTDKLEQTNPFLAKLPYETLEYKIDYKITPGANGKVDVSLIIDLYAVLNNAQQKAAYQQQLQEYKQKALLWMKGQGVDEQRYPITYNPQI